MKRFMVLASLAKEGWDGCEDRYYAGGLTADAAAQMFGNGQITEHGFSSIEGGGQTSNE